MPRRKVKRISATELACFDTIVAELSGREEFAGYDFSTLTLSAMYQLDPTIRPENLRKAITNIERHIALKCKEPLDFLVFRASLARITKISRPTVTRWCDDGLITPSNRHVLFHKEIDDVYDLEVVLEQLRAIEQK